MKKFIVFLACFMGLCVFSPICAQDENHSVETEEMVNDYVIQKGFCIGMEDFTPDVAPYLTLWTSYFF